MANALGALFSDIANAIRGKTGNEGTMKPAEFPAAIDGIVMKADPVLAELTVSENGLYVPGEGVDGFNSVTVNVADSGADTEEIDDLLDEINGEFIAEAQYTFTFIGASGEVLCEVPVYDTQDCPDPITAGIITKPTKEPTTELNFTYSHWSATEGGAADSSIFQNVTEDRTVYAVFTSTVRFYTVKFWDGENVLKTYTHKYGEMPITTYEPEKYGYGFVAWEPEITTVTGNANYYAQWTEVVTFANGSWAEIAEIAESGEAQNTFSIGDTKEISFVIGDITENLTLEIVDFNKDVLSDGTGTAGITIICKNLTLSEQAYATAKTKSDFWGTCDLRTWCNGTVYNALPEKMRAVLKQIKNPNKIGTDGVIAYVDDYCWVPSVKELGYTEYYNSDTGAYEDIAGFLREDFGETAYAAYSSGGLVGKKYRDADGNEKYAIYSTRSRQVTKYYVISLDDDINAAGDTVQPGKIILSTLSLSMGNYYDNKNNVLLGFCI